MRGSAVAALVLEFCTTGHAGAQATISSIPALPGIASPRVRPRAVSSDGQVVVGDVVQQLPPGYPEFGFVWTENGGTQLIPGVTDAYHDTIAFSVGMPGPTIV